MTGVTSVCFTIVFQFFSQYHDGSRTCAMMFSYLHSVVTQIQKFKRKHYGKP